MNKECSTTTIDSSPLVFPVAVIVDTREQTPFLFQGIRADAKDKRRPIEINIVNRCLSSGDYSLDGFESRVAIERKSLSDLYGTLGKGRQRFEKELQRLAMYDFAAVVVEAAWLEILGTPPDRSQLHPLTVYRSVIAWQQRYPRIHWWMCPDRTFAERTTFRILQRFFLDRSH